MEEWFHSGRKYFVRIIQNFKVTGKIVEKYGTEVAKNHQWLDYIGLYNLKRRNGLI